jgi:chromosome segregation ATPase
VEKIRGPAARIILRTLKNLPALKDSAVAVEFKELLDRLDQLLQQCEELGETLGIVARLFEDSADLSTQLGGDQNRADQMRTISETLEQTGATLTQIRGKVAELRQRESAPDPQKLADLIEQSRGPLERLADGIARTREHCVDARESLDNVRREVRFWTVTGAILLSLVLVWFGLGQVCLFGWGWKRLRRRSLPIAPKEMNSG